MAEPWRVCSLTTFPRLPLSQDIRPSGENVEKCPFCEVSPKGTEALTHRLAKERKGQIRPTAGFCELGCTGTQPVFRAASGCFHATVTERSGVTEIERPTRPKIFTTWPSTNPWYN